MASTGISAAGVAGTTEVQGGIVVRPAYIAILFLAIAALLFALSSRKSETDISRRVRRRTAIIFGVVGAGLLVLDLTGA